MQVAFDTNKDEIRVSYNDQCLQVISREHASYAYQQAKMLAETNLRICQLMKLHWPKLVSEQ